MCKFRLKIENFPYNCCMAQEHCPPVNCSNNYKDCPIWIKEYNISTSADPLNKGENICWTTGKPVESRDKKL